MLPEQRAGFAARAARLPHVHAITFNAHLEALMARAAGVVAMGGYNTFCEILSFDKPALIVPRTHPALEQYIRAERAAELGLVAMLAEHEGRDPRVMAVALRQLPGSRRPRAWSSPACSTACANVNRLPGNGSTGASRRAARCGRAAAHERPPPAPVRPARVAFVLKGYPRLSETFIAQEILALERRGLGILIVSLRQPTDRASHPVHAAIRADRLYLPEYLYREPLRVLARLAARPPAAGLPRGALRALARAICVRDPTPNRVRRFGQALVLAAEMPGRYRSSPCPFSAYAGLGRALRGADARPAAGRYRRMPRTSGRFRTGRSARKLGDRALGGDLHRDRARPSRGAGAAAGPGRVVLSRPRPRPLSGAAAAPALPAMAAIRDAPVVLLSVGRAVAKKGYDDLLAALALLPPDLAWRFVHIGGGSLAPKLRSQAAGARPRRPRSNGAAPCRSRRCSPPIARADLFVLAAKIAADGDRDGLPNVLMEAQSQGLACVATDISGIPELIEDGATGLLVPPGDPPALAPALAELIGDPARRAALGAAGERRVRGAFAMTAGIDLLAARFGLEPVDARSAPRPAPAATPEPPPRNSPRRTSRPQSHAHRLLCAAEAARSSGPLGGSAGGAAVGRGAAPGRARTGAGLALSQL